MRPVRYTLANAAVDPQIGAVIPMDIYIAPFSVSIQADVTGAATYTVEYTLDDIWAPGYNPATGHWIPLVGMTDATADANTFLVSPVTGVRARQTAGAGSVALTVIQAGIA